MIKRYRKGECYRTSAVAVRAVYLNVRRGMEVVLLFNSGVRCFM